MSLANLEKSDQVVQSLELFTEEECVKIHEPIYQLKEFWHQRHPFLPFYTLGLASPYDVPINKQYYSQNVDKYNTILREQFQWLYDRLADKLAQQLGQSVSYPKNLALPGFHIFLSHKAFEESLGAIHCDKSYMFHWNPAEGIDFDRPVSFTVAIKLPKFGGGMNIWDLSYQEVRGLNHHEIEQLAISRNKSFHPYKLGNLVLHSGHKVHQIAPTNHIQPQDSRITLQGHGLFCHGSWQIHW